MEWSEAEWIGRKRKERDELDGRRRDGIEMVCSGTAGVDVRGRETVGPDGTGTAGTDGTGPERTGLTGQERQ